MNDNNEALDDFEVPRPEYLGGKSWNLKNRTPITVIFGKNASGKSILLRTIHQKNPDIFHYCVPERGGEISFQPENVIQQLDPNQRANLSKENQNLAYR